MKVRILAGAAVAAVCVVAIGAERPVPPGAGTSSHGMDMRAGGAQMRQVSAPVAHQQGAGYARTRNGRRGGSGVNKSRLDQQDRTLLDSIENADSSAALSRLMSSAMASRNAEVRQAMVDALADKGRKGANGLAYFIADPDDDVAESAFSAWTSILDEYGASGRAAAIISASAIIQQASSHGGRQVPHGVQQAPHGVPPSRR